MPEPARAASKTRPERANPVRRDDRPTRAERDAYAARGAYYGLYLCAQGFAADEAAVVVLERYPRLRPVLERLTRRPVADPLAVNGER